MPKRYAREFRRIVCERLLAGAKVSSLSEELGVSEATLYLWKRQALIDAGRAEGVKSFRFARPPTTRKGSACAPLARTDRQVPTSHCASLPFS